MNDLKSLRDRALGLLARWAPAVEGYWQGMADDPALGCYGPGYQHWGVQSNWNFAAAMATLAAHTPTAESAPWRMRALAALRYALATHVTGHRKGTDGKPWGNTWISMLGIERAMHGVATLERDLTEDDREALRRLLINEADWLWLHARRGKHTGVVAGLWDSGGTNNPESNIWSGALLWRVAQLYPEEAHADAWREQAHRFLMNGVSIEADAQDPTQIAGRAVADWHVGANFFPHYALDHHGYLNVGYMVICVSNAAILHFDLRRMGAVPPPSLYHHQADLWLDLRRFIFADGRLARIGGDSRVRYAYCQEYLLPTLLFAADHHQDAQALTLVDRQLGLMEQEAAAGEGLFYGHRLDPLRARNPHYFTRLESDRACVLAMLVNMLPLVRWPPASADTFEKTVAGGWMEDAHGAVMHRSATRLCSFSWRACEVTQGLCLPPDDGSLAAWALNLSPVVRCLGDDGARPAHHRRLLAHHQQSFADGFVTSGAVMEGVNVPVDEGTTCTDQATTHLAFAALPDGHTCLCLQQVVAAADRVLYLATLKDLHLVVPNDVFNGHHRTLHTAAGRTVLQSPPARDEVLTFATRWASIDDRLGIVVLKGGAQILVDRCTRRREGRYASLYTEEFCLQVRSGVARCEPGEVLVDIGFAVLSGVSATATAAVCGSTLALNDPMLRGVWVADADGRRYALLANFTRDARRVDVEGETLELEAGCATVRELHRDPGATPAG